MKFYGMNCRQGYYHLLCQQFGIVQYVRLKAKNDIKCHGFDIVAIGMNPTIYKY